MTENRQTAAAAPPFPVIGALKETLAFIWHEKWWLLVRALLPAVIGGVTFVLTFPPIGIYATWQIALMLLMLLFSANMLVSTQRHLLRGEKGNRFADFLPRLVDLTYFGVWIGLALGYWVLGFMGDVLGSLIPIAGAIFNLGIAIIYFLILIRLIALFPLVAVQDRTPFRTAWHLSDHQLGRLIVFVVLAGLAITVVLAGILALLAFAGQWPIAAEPETALMARLVNIGITVPYFGVAISLMIALEAAAAACAVACKTLQELREAAKGAA